MGTVYCAEQVTMQREVAVKILNPSKVSDPKVIEGFIREGKIAVILSHHTLGVDL
jgi:serine/threonine protein kinase